MPRIHEYTQYEAFLNLVISSPRPEAIPSHIVANASKHDEIASNIRAILREWKHVNPSDQFTAAANRITTYLPVSGTNPFYAARLLTPAGSLIEVNEGFLLDILRLRWTFIFVLLPGAFQADERSGFAFERHWQKAWKDLLTAQGMLNVFIPGDSERRPGDRTEIDLMIEVGAGSVKNWVDISGS